MAQTRTVLITGAAARVGRSIALSLAGAGWDVAIHYNRSLKDAESLATLIRRKKRKAYLVKADLSDAKAVSKIIPSLAKQKVKLDCLINCAATFEKDTLATLTPESWHLHATANLLAPIMLIRDFAAHYKGTQGNVINIIDGMVGWSMSPAFFSYAMSKHGLAHATQMLMRELAPRIRINAIAPGATLRGKQEKEDTIEKFLRMIPLKHMSSPDEIHRTIHFILSSESLTGQIISLAGGMDLP